jgi:hypothetical protein
MPPKPPKPRPKRGKYGHSPLCEAGWMPLLRSGARLLNCFERNCFERWRKDMYVNNAIQRQRQDFFNAHCSEAIVKAIEHLVDDLNGAATVDVVCAYLAHLHEEGKVPLPPSRSSVHRCMKSLNMTKKGFGLPEVGRGWVGEDTNQSGTRFLAH